MSAASYALRQVKYVLSTDSLKLIYFAHVQSIMNYGLIFWDNSPSAKKVFKLQKKIIRIIANIGMRETFLLPTDAHNVKKHRVIKTF